MTDLQHTAIIQEEFSRAEKFRRNGNFETARSLYLKLLKQLPGNTQVLCNLADIIENENDDRLAESITLLREAIQSDPENKDTLFNLGRVYQELGEQSRVDKGSCLTLGGSELFGHDSTNTPETQESKNQAVGQVWTSYLTKYPDPQANFKTQKQQCRKDDPSYVFPVLSSCLFHDLPLTIFIDEPNPRVADKIKRSNAECRVIERTVTSANDERFYAYRDAIDELSDEQILLLTDCSDVYFKRDPFEYLARAPGVVLGEDIEGTPLIFQNHYLMTKYQAVAEKGLLSPSDIELVNKGFLVNAGVIGGRVKHLKMLLSVTCWYLEKWRSLDQNLNMPALNLAVNQMAFPVWIGKPFTSGFKQFEVDSSYYVVHK